MTQVLMHAINLGGEQSERVFALAMCCQPTVAQWAEFDSAINRVGVFASVGRRGGLIKVRLEEDFEWDSRLKFAGYACSASDLPTLILRQIMAPASARARAVA